MQPEELSEGNLTNIKKESGYDQEKKKKDVSEEITQVKKFHINGTFGDISQHECTKDKMLEADPNLGRRVTIHMDIQKIHSPRYRKSHNRRTPAVFKTTLNIFQTKK